MNRTTTRALLGAGAAALFLLPACSDKGDTAETTDTTAGGSSTTVSVAEATTVAPDAVAAFCHSVADADSYFQSLDGPPDQATVDGLYQQMTDTAPAELDETVATMITENDKALAQGENGEESEAFTTAYGDVMSWMGDSCGWNSLDVEAENYAYSGIPDSLPAGPVIITFTNTGTEFHELLLMRINDGVTESVDELLALPEDEAKTKATQEGAAFAAPGEQSFSTADLEAGHYVALCPLPKGMTPEAMAGMESGGTEPQGEPHFMLGMVREFEVD